MPHQFGTFAETAPWIYTAIAMALLVIVVVHIYLQRRRRLRRLRRRQPPEGSTTLTRGALAAKCFYASRHTRSTRCDHIPEWHCEDCARRPQPGPDGLLPYPDMPRRPRESA
jgi:heme exporter protein D